MKKLRRMLDEEDRARPDKRAYTAIFGACISKNLGMYLLQSLAFPFMTLLPSRRTEKRT